MFLFILVLVLIALIALAVLVVTHIVPIIIGFFCICGILLIWSPPKHGHK